MMVLRRYTLPWVILRDLIFLLDSSFLGLSPLHEVRWFAVSNLLISVPISAINDVAARSLIPEIFCKRLSASGKCFSHISNIRCWHSFLWLSAMSISSWNWRSTSVSACETTPDKEANIATLEYAVYLGNLTDNLRLRSKIRRSYWRSCWIISGGTKLPLPNSFIVHSAIHWASLTSLL